MPVKWTPQNFAEALFHYQKETGKTSEDIARDSGLSVDELKELVSCKSKNIPKKLYGHVRKNKHLAIKAWN